MTKKDKDRPNVRVPERRSIGYDHDVEQTAGSGWWYVNGPAIGPTVLIEDETDARTIAAALNLACNFAAVKRKAQELTWALE